MRALLRITYDGTDFAGCGPLPDERTIIGEVVAALERVSLRPSLAEALSRTDAGVHARANVAHVVLPRAVAEDRLLAMLDRHLPADLRCLAVAVVEGLPPVGAKTYRYRLDTTRHGDPFLARTAWRVPGRLDLDVLPGLAAACVGTHDFEAFRRRGETRDDLTRSLLAARWERRADTVEFVVTGDGFTYRLVRSLVGAMVSVARSSSSEADFRGAIAGVAGPVTRQTAPAHGLCLEGLSLVGLDLQPTSTLNPPM